VRVVSGGSGSNAARETGSGSGPPEHLALAEERDFCLRSLRDLDSEVAAGDIDRADYETLRDSYTVRAAAALRALAAISADSAHAGDSGDATAAGQGPGSAEVTEVTAAPPAGRARRRAGIALGAVLIAAGASWAVVESSATRLPGQEITGQAVGSQQIAADLLAAQKAAGTGDALTALKDYQKVLAARPGQVEALTGEGWLLAQTQQPALLRQGLGLLASAEKSSPSYAPAHLYRGISLLSEDDYAGAVPELQWYLGHSPDPQLAPQVRTALQQAQAKLQQQQG